MACILTENDIKWMTEKHPKMLYYAKYKALAGEFSFSAQYKDNERIDDHYKIAIFSDYPPDSPLPAIFEIDCRIKRMSHILGIDISDLHVNYDDSLCIIRPDKFKLWYPNGFSIKVFERNLVSHFYWLSYRERYGIEPWEGEQHGGQYNW